MFWRLRLLHRLSVTGAARARRCGLTCARRLAPNQTRLGDWPQPPLGPHRPDVETAAGAQEEKKKKSRRETRKYEFEPF